MDKQELLKELAIKLLDNAVLNNLAVRLEFKNLNDKTFYQTYDDTSGQRSSYLRFYTYNHSKGQKDDGFAPGIYHVKRKLTFENKTDVGKNNSVLGVLNLNNSNVSEVTENYIVLNSTLSIYIGDRVLKIEEDASN